MSIIRAKMWVWPVVVLYSVQVTTAVPSAAMATCGDDSTSVETWLMSFCVFCGTPLAL